MKTLQQLAELDVLDRRHVLRNLSDEEAQNVENVLMCMPHVTMDVTSEGQSRGLALRGCGFIVVVGEGCS